MFAIIYPHESKNKIRTIMEREQLNYFLQRAPSPLLSALCEKIGKEVYFWVNKDFLYGVLGEVRDYVQARL